MSLYEKIQATIQYIQQRIDFQADFGLILGTGLSQLGSEIESVATFNYSELPHFPTTTVASHQGKLIFGHLAGKRVVAMAGRFHYYEGYSMEEVTFPIRVLKYLGIQQLLVSNAAGSINANIEAGDLVFIKDHINLHAANPLRGKNDERIGPRFPDMMNAYDQAWNKQALQIAAKHKIVAHEGVYVGLQGPNLETPAEYKFLNIIGGDVVGMSTIPEVIVARHMDMTVFAMSVVSNKCFPIEELTPTTLEEVIAVVKMTAVKAQLIVRALLRNM